jgi:hypothetical protein
MFVAGRATNGAHVRTVANWKSVERNNPRHHKRRAATMLARFLFIE